MMNTKLLAQGGINVRYVPIKAINASLKGQEVKIDFKSKREKRALAQKSRIADTVKITLDNKPVDVIEVKGRGVDYWYFDREYLQSHTYQPGMILQIHKIVVQDITKDSILFRMTLQLFKMNENKTLNEQSSEIQDIWIPKKSLDGIMIKI